MPGEFTMTIKTRGNQYSDMWRYARQILVLAIVAAIVSTGLLVKVEAAAGDLDTSFSQDGKLRATFGLKDEVAYGVAIQPDGKIVAGGYTPKGSTQFDFALMRFNSDGSLDTTFSEDGKVRTEFGVESAAFGIAIQPNGKIVLGGWTRNPDNFAAARYNTDGSLDNTFSDDGKVITDFTGGSDTGRDVAIQPNGKIVLAGLSSNSQGDFGIAVVRYNTDGTLDKNFSGDGKVRTFIGSSAIGMAVAIQSDSKIVVAGHSSSNSDGADFTLVRYNGNGGLDDGTVNDRTPGDMFGTNGIVTTDFFSNYDVVNDVDIQSDGKIVAAGYAAHRNFTTNPDFALARYNIDGTLDMTFSGDGKQSTDLFGSNRDEAQALAIQPDGKIVLAGYLAKSNGDADFALARYLGD
jgi:uncharacterized delta-60 repeat protein